MTDELAEARAKIEAARNAIRSTPELAHLAERLERMAVEVRRVEQRLAKGHPVQVQAVSPKLGA